MGFQFKRQKYNADPVILVLSLDRKKMTERILIGTEIEITKRLRFGDGSFLFFDRKRPLGTMLTEYNQDAGNEWISYGFMPLWDALHTNRFKQPALEQKSADFLSMRYASGDPVLMFTAIRLWNGYLRAREPRDRDTAAGLYQNDMTRLTAPLLNITNDMLMQDDLPEYIKKSEYDRKLDLWFPSETDSEYVIIRASFLPGILYYKNRLNEWGLHFRSCKVCGKIFLAKSRKYEICGDACRKQQGLNSKRAFDARARENSYDLVYKNECQNWRNRIRKAKKTPGVSQKRLAKMKSAFEAFKTEALIKKSAVKAGELSVKEFTGWILRQGVVLDRLQR